MKPLRILDEHKHWSETNRLLSEFVNDYFKDSTGNKKIEILEAGCGTKWNLNLEFDHVLTGVDVSREAMEIRKEQHGDIDEFIVGDLSTVQIDKNAFDVIYCSYVLEHLSGAEAVLNRFFEWLRPGGLAILLFPDRDSVFGFVTRLTPQWFHVFYYKHIEKLPNAGEPGHGPFPTYYDAVVSRSGIHKYCQKWGYDIKLEFAMPLVIPQAAGAVGPLISACVKILAVCSLGHLTDKHQNLALIVHKQ